MRIEIEFFGSVSILILRRRVPANIVLLNFEGSKQVIERAIVIVPSGQEVRLGNEMLKDEIAVRQRHYKRFELEWIA